MSRTQQAIVSLLMIAIGNMLIAIGNSQLVDLGASASYFAIPTAFISVVSWLFLIASTWVAEGAELPTVTLPRLHMPKIAFPRMRFSWPRFGRKRKRSYAFNADAMGSVGSLDELFD